MRPLFLSFLAATVCSAQAQTRKAPGRPAVAAPTTVQARGTTTPLQLQDWFASPMNIRAFGAIGDDATDNATAFANALAACGTAGATQILIPDGNYRISTPLTLPNHCWLVGIGKTTAVLRFTYNDSTAAAITFADQFYQGLSNLNLDHTTPLVQTAYVSNGSGTAVRMASATYATLERVRITNFETGVRVSGESTWLRLTDVIAGNCGTGFSLTNPNFVHFLRCISDGNQDGFYLQSTTKAVLDTCTAQATYDTTVGAVQIVDADNTELRGMWFERNQGHDVEIKGASRLTRVYESLIQGAGWNLATATLTGVGDGLRISGTSSNTLIDGGWFGGNATRDLNLIAGTTKTVVRNARSNLALVFLDGAADSVWETSDYVIRRPASLYETVPGSSSNSMARPAVGTAIINGERMGGHPGSPTSDDGFQRISAGGGTSAATKTYIDLSGYSTVADMNQNIVMGTGGAERARLSSFGFLIAPVLFANLGAPANGTIVYCSNCTVANPCATGGTGALAKRLNGAWVCN